MRHYLLVDDNEAFAENLAEILRDQGDDVTVATSGEEALVEVRACRFDALLTDMRMPVMGGAELVHHVRAIDPGLPAIVATAYTGDEELRIAREEGLLAVLQKPVPVPTLLGLLSSAKRDGMVVLVEDDELLADNLTEALRSAGFTAVSAHTVAETERLRVVRPFAALVDLRVPGGPDGAAMRRLRERFPRLPQVVITAHDVSAADAGAVRIFRKPFATAELLAELARLYRAQEAA
ncbi:MAG: response regulator [Myxococcaceae bacterium]|nr:response regulator [Myxococcaceae bacterium]